MAGDRCHLPWGQWSPSELLCWGSLCFLAIRSHLLICLVFPSLSHIPNVPSSCQICGVFHLFTVTRTFQNPFHQSLPQFLGPEKMHWVRIVFCTDSPPKTPMWWLPVPGDSHGICMARAASTRAQHQVVSQTTPSSGLYAKTSVWNACWVQFIHSQKIV